MFNIKHIIILIFACCFILNNSLAEEGDDLIIIGDIVNLRTGPASDSEVALKLVKDRKLIEIQRQGEWVEVETNREDITTGWVHKSLVKHNKAIGRPLSADKRFERFKQRFDDQNEVLTKQNGDTYFIDVKDEGEGTLGVIASAFWINAEREERERTINTVFKLWSNVVPVGSSMALIVFDEQGEQHMVMLR